MIPKNPLHHITYTAIKLEVARSNGLGGDIFTRNVTGARTNAKTDGPTLVRN